MKVDEIRDNETLADAKRIGHLPPVAEPEVQPQEVEIAPKEGGDSSEG